MDNDLKMKEIKAVAFDIDGTLYPNRRLYRNLIGYFLKNFMFFYFYNNVRHILHRTAVLPDFYEYQARLLAEEMKIPVEKAKEKINAIVYKGLEPFFVKIKPFDYIEETFIAFKDANLKLALLSDFPPEQKGDVWGTKKHFDVILGSEECGALKPSVYPFKVLAESLNLEPSEILYVGNSIRCDVEGAHNAGMKTAYIMPLWRKIFNKKLRKADISFKTYRQLCEIVLQ